MSLREAQEKLIIEEAKKQITQVAENGGNVFEIAIQEIDKIQQRIGKIYAK
jgi:hypothetical protein